MARIFAGNDSLVDPDVLDAVKRLSDDFFVFAEIDIDRRNIDWLIIRAASDQRDDALSSAAILTELKRVSAPVTGTVQDEWKVERIDGSLESVSGGQEKNPYWQAVAAANALRSWLWNHHKLFCERAGDSAEVQESNFSVWPDVLLLPRHDLPIEHRLPVRPANGFGMWWFDLDRWLQHVVTWRPNQRDRTRRFTEQELLRLAELFDAHELPSSGEAPARAVQPDQRGAESAMQPFLSYLRNLEDRIAELNRRVQALEADRAPDHDNDGVAYELMPPDSAGPELPPDQSEAIASTVRAFAMAGRRAVFPAVIKEIERQVGVSLKQTQYEGFGSARAYFDRARTLGLLSYGPPDESGAPTLLPVESPVAGSGRSPGR